MAISFNHLLIFGIPEGICIVFLAFALSKVKLHWKKVIPIGIFLSFSAFILRLLPITFGVHTIVYIGLLFYFLVKVGKVPLVNAITNSLATFLLVIIFETTTSSLIMKIFEINQTQLNENLLTRLLVIYPHIILLFISALLVKRYKKI